MLVNFNQYHLNKYIASPSAPHVDPMHPTLDESIDMIRNLITVNLITRGLPRNLIRNLPTLECAYTIWKFLEECFPNYSLKNLDEILHKSISLSKMNTSDPMFGDCLFELTNLMHAKGNVGIISDIISEATRIQRGDYCQTHTN